MNVAQLKHTMTKDGMVFGASFPRLNERGSIEASSHWRLKLAGGRFPRLNERGSIEASFREQSGQLSTSFPRLNERGSIEASLINANPTYQNRRFHV